MGFLLYKIHKASHSKMPHDPLNLKGGTATEEFKTK